MKLPPRASVLIFLSALLIALGFHGWVNFVRQERVKHVTDLGAEHAVPDPSTSTGWAGNRRWLIASEHNNDSYQWIMETQRMLATGDWRLRRVAYDNGGEERASSTPDPYRWWLALTAKGQQWLSGTSTPLAVERAAFVADPLLLGLLLLAGGILLAGRLGPWPAAVWLVAGAWLYPFSASFVPGAPDSLGLSLGLTAASVGLAVAGWLGRDEGGSDGAGRWLVAAGVAGGLGLWVDLVVQLPVLLGMTVGAVVAAGIRKSDNPDAGAEKLWRLWGWAGGITSLAAWGIANFPANLTGELRGNHPIVGLAWIGAGELLAQFCAMRSGARPWSGWMARGRAILGIAALGGAGYLIWQAELPWLKGRDVFGTRLTSLPLSAVAESLPAWFGQAGTKLPLLAVLLPLGLVVPTCWWGRRPGTTGRDRTGLALALGPLVFLLYFAWFQIRWWSNVEAMLLVVVVAVTALLAREPGRGALHGWLVVLGCVLLPGLICQKPVAKAQYEQALTQLEVEGLVERSLAHWLADRAGQTPVVLAPPFRTTALSFHGNMQALGSLNLANKEALEAAARIASATSPDEALALIHKRGVTHIVMPSWDAYLEEYARLFTSRPENSFVYALKQWAMPPWLIPVAYQLPTIGGFEGQSAFVFEVAEEQDQATTLSRLAEYFLEMGQGALAVSASRGLAIYPENLPALTALAQIQLAQGDQVRFAATFKTLLTVYQSVGEHDLSWDRRVSLAVVLMQGKRAELARGELEICLSLMDEAGLRSLSVGSLYRFQVLLRALGLRIEDERLAALATSLLPEALRRSE